MPNDAKLGLVLGLGLVIAIGVIYFRKDQAATPDTVDSTAAVPSESPAAAPGKYQLTNTRSNSREESAPGIQEEKRDGSAPAAEADNDPSR